MVDKSRKTNVSISFHKSLLNRLDEWITWQRENRDYEVDRSHVINVLLDTFLEKNQPKRTKITDGYRPDYSELSIAD